MELLDLLFEKRIAFKILMLLRERRQMAPLPCRLPIRDNVEYC